MFIIYLSISKPFNSKPFIAFKKILLEITNISYSRHLYLSWHAFITLFKMYVDKEYKFKNK